MKHNKSIFCLALLIFILLIFICGHSIEAKTDYDIFSDILRNTNSEVIETGANISFEDNKNYKNVCNNIVQNVQNKNSLKEKKVYSKVVLDDGRNYCVKFKTLKMSGYVESNKLENNRARVNIVVKENTRDNDLKDIEKKLMRSSSTCSYLQCYKYLKAKSKMKNLKNIDVKVKKILSSIGTQNIKTVVLNKNLSTTAYTKRFNYIQDGDRKIDLNYSICKDGDESSIIIGTPIIPITY
ncbi:MULTISPECIES: YwmB family TATA-box binding protein [Clostridium]|uniref:YwmB family TATA-box binding protein n=1 Tax=Clostridium TaxID=1485 RepID=UPI000824651E|nr:MULTISPECIES: YwmB family TATA-box binding protein [Clostridium]PJI09159.1 hypothetical protein CUB90_15315 [Clostridium sp. CT7]